jgi:two-component system response regulator CpxR
MLNVSAAEFDILLVFLQRAGQTLSRESLSLETLGRKWTVYDRAIDMHVSNLRKKLGPLPDGRERLQNVRGAGYVYVRAVQPKSVEP